MSKELETMKEVLCKQYIRAIKTYKIAGPITVAVLVLVAIGLLTKFSDALQVPIILIICIAPLLFAVSSGAWFMFLIKYCKKKLKELQDSKND